MIDSAALIVDALSLIQENGQDVVVARLTSGEDPVMPVVASRTVSQYVRTSAVALPATRSRTGRFDKSLMNGRELSSMFFLIVAADGGMSIQPGDVIILADETALTVLGARDLAPAGTPIIFEVIAHAGSQLFTFVVLNENFIGLDTEAPSFLVGENEELLTFD